MTLTVASLFDGIGGFPLAFERAGATTVATVEIDPEAAAISRRHFPHAHQFDDVTKVTGDDLRAVGFVPDRGILTAGWPCQDFSVAGRRAGLDGARSGLWWEVVRILAELKPRWFLGENVPGLLSSVCDPECEGGCMARHGGAFGAVLGSLGQLGYGVAYRVLDAQFFGVPQRRQRVFIVGHLGTPFTAPAQVLLEPEGGERDSAAGREARESVTGPAPRSVGALGNGGEVVPALVARYQKGPDSAATQALIVEHTHTHTARSPRFRAAGNAATGSTPNQQPGDTWSSRKVVAALTSNGVGTCGADDNQAQAGHLIPTEVDQTLYSIMPMNSGRDYKARAVEVAQPLMTSPVGGNQGGDYVVSVTGDIAHTLTAEGADASEDGTGRGTPIVAYAPDTAATLTSGTSSPGVSAPGRRQEDDANIIVQPLALRGRSHGAELEIGPEGGPYTALRAGESTGQRLIAIGFHATQDPIHSEERVPAIGAKSIGNGVAVPIDMRNACRTNESSGTGVGKPGDPCYTLSTLPRGRPAVQTETVVRRLTELECERLQGYPPVLQWSDDMTKDEFIAAVLSTGMVKADAETGKVWVLRGPGGILLKEPREITGTKCNGYLVAKFSLGKLKRQVRLHRLIWIAANGIPDAGMAVCHRDDVKTNNRIDNLYLATPQRNSTDAKESGRYLSGEDNPQTKISEELRQTICDDYKHSEATLADLAARYGISKSRVHQIVRRDGWTDGQSGSARYRQLGNSVAVPVVEWIARRLVAVDEELT